jgi:hypothetical protein
VTLPAVPSAPHVEAVHEPRVGTSRCLLITCHG